MLDVEVLLFLGVGVHLVTKVFDGARTFNARRGNDIVLAFDVALFTFNLPYAILTLLVPGFRSYIRCALQQ